ncbi:MAG: AAA family ATPase [Thiomargarita sp.]|nr:AAA family ATPase [Thiomargarita sp.]MCK5716050.1 AAA family ATPase [Thiomargarita sp.]
MPTYMALEFEVLPDGLKSIISWLSDLFMRMDRIPWLDDCRILERRFILFLDEIEIHLHPIWQRKILPVIQKLFPNAQIFVSSHSPFIVASVSDAYVYKFRLENEWFISFRHH